MDVIMKQKTNLGYDVWFTSDCHFQHKNVLKHCKGRMTQAGCADENDVETHDKWLIETWNKTVGKKDHVYILGDFAFGSQASVRKILDRLNGKKYLILGNHDKSSEKITTHFEQICQQKMLTFKKDQWDFLDEDFMIFCIHYAPLVWPSKHYGCVAAYGHSHGNLDEYESTTGELRVDVGLDGTLANYGLVSLEQLYKHYKKISGGKKFLTYAMERINENKTQI